VVLDWLTGALALVAVLQLAAFVVQAIALRETVVVTRDTAEKQSKDTQESLALAKQAADAATAANKLTQDFFITTGRPWVNATLVIDQPVILANNTCQLRGRFVLKNVGHSPAGRTTLLSEAFDGNGSRPSVNQDALQERARTARMSDTSRQGANIYRDQQTEIEASWIIRANEGSNGRILPVIACCATYNFVGVRDHLQSGYTFLVDWPMTVSGPSGPAGSASHVIPPTVVDVRPWFEAPTEP
jgi:hypothetical protein